jgi:hypothetical protein
VKFPPLVRATVGVIYTSNEYIAAGTFFCKLEEFPMITKLFDDARGVKTLMYPNAMFES